MQSGSEWEMDTPLGRFGEWRYLWENQSVFRQFIYWRQINQEICSRERNCRKYYLVMIGADMSGQLPGHLGYEDLGNGSGHIGHIDVYSCYILL